MSLLKTRLLILSLSCLYLTNTPLQAEKKKSDMPPISLRHVEKKAFPLILSAYYTFWEPYTEGMNIAYSLGDTIEFGNFIRPQNTSKSGFIIGAGWNSYHDKWRVTSHYTWFYNCPVKHMQGLKDTTPYKTPFSEVTFFSDYIVSQFTNQFNRLDATIDKQFFTGRFIAIRPWIGLLGAWEVSHLNFNMKADAEHSEETDIKEYQFTQKWKAIGPYAGIEGTYFLVKQFGFFLSSGASLCRANHSITQQIKTVDDQGTVLDIPPTNIDTFYKNIEPMLEASIGARCDMEWRKFTLRIEAAWQLQTYFSHNGFQGYYSPVGLYGNYSMEGLTLGFNCTF